MKISNFEPMVEFAAVILKFDKQGEKTGWSYIQVPASVAEKLNPGQRKAFRVKGSLDQLQISKVALMPLGNGDFIMPVNGSMRKALRKQKGATVKVQINIDDKPPDMPADFRECLEDEPAALKYFQSLPQGHRNYFAKWIGSAKTDQTRAKRIAQAITALSRQMGFAELLRAAKAEKQKLL